jgi:peptidoglycan hydrolase-like protein with peptidoglycan-binding domain
MDYESQMKAIKACGYMTSSTEVNSVLTTIRNFNLTQYDFADDNSAERNPYKPPTGTLKLGVKNEGVRWLQFELNKYGYSLAVDGTFGRITRNAVIDYQREHGLVADGIVGQKTLAKLLL